MLRLTPTLFLFEAVLSGGDCCVEVIAERIATRRGERDPQGYALEPDEAAHIVLHSVEHLEGALPLSGIGAFEAGLLELAEQLYHEAAGQNSHRRASISAWRRGTGLLI